MKVLTTIVLWYCVGAALALATLITITVAALRDAQLRTAAEEPKLASLAAEAADKKAAYLDLRERQRGERAEYAAPEAVAASYAVQQAHEAYLAVQQSLDELEDHVTRLCDEQYRKTIGLIPYILALLVHALAATAIWPYRRPVKDKSG